MNHCVDSDIATRFWATVQRMLVVSVVVHDISPKSINCHGNVPWQIGQESLAVASKAQDVVEMTPPRDDNVR